MVTTRDFPKGISWDQGTTGRGQGAVSLQVGYPAASVAIRPGGPPGPGQANLFPTLSVGSMVSGHD